MKRTIETKFNIGDKVTWNDDETIYTIKDIVLSGSINCIGQDYIIQYKDKVIYAFESELEKVGK